MTGRAARGPGRPPALTPDVVARAVLEVGFTDLTLVAVQKQLGVGQSTLFRYVGDRDGLVRLGLDLMMRQIDWPSLEGPWRSVLERYASTAWHVWAAHPGSASEASRGNLPTVIVGLSDTLSALLMRHGFTPAGAVLACDLVFDLVIDNRRIAEHLDQQVVGAGPSREGMAEMWRNPVSSENTDADRPTPAEHGAIHAAVIEAIHARPYDWFGRKLAVVLDGIEQALAPPVKH